MEDMGWIVLDYQNTREIHRVLFKLLLNRGSIMNWFRELFVLAGMIFVLMFVYM